MLSGLLSRLVIILFGLLFPAYNSFKAIRTKNIREYTKWMIYWIVFSLFTTAELITDMFISWFPFYYEIKVVFVFWLLSPITKGAHILYTRVIHPQFMKHEKEIDSYLEQVSEKGYASILELGTKGIDCIVTGLATGAIKAQQMMEQIQDVKEGETLEVKTKESKTKTTKKKPRKRSLEASKESAMQDDSKEQSDDKCDDVNQEEVKDSIDRDEAASSNSHVMGEPSGTIAAEELRNVFDDVTQTSYVEPQSVTINGQSKSTTDQSASIIDQSASIDNHIKRSRGEGEGVKTNEKQGACKKSRYGRPLKRPVHYGYG